MTATSKGPLRAPSPLKTEPNRSPKRDVGIDIAEAMANVTFDDLPAATVEEPPSAA